MDAGAKSKIPNYIKYFFIISNILLTGFLVIIGNPVLVPLIAAGIIAILLKPLSVKLEYIGVPRIISAWSVVILFLILIILFITFFTAQLANISGDTALSSESLDKLFTSIQSRLASWFNISFDEQIKLLNTSFRNAMTSIVAYFPTALAGTAAYFLTILLFIISVFFFIYYRSFLLSFVYKFFVDIENSQIKTTITKIENAVKNYIVGLFIVITIMAILTSLGLLFLGIRHAIFFGVLGALLTIIPYVGITIGALLPTLFALLTTDSLWYPIGVILVFSSIQFLEGNFVTPMIVGHKQNINPFVAILGLFIGGMLLGPTGVILAIPILGIIKIFCDEISSLQPIGYILGRNRQETTLFKFMDKLFGKNK